MPGVSQVKRIRRIIESVLFVLGATATALAGAAGFAFLTCLMIFPLGRDAWGAVGFITVLALIAGVIGAIAGLLGSIFWVTQERQKLWTFGTWIGIPLGLVIGLAVRFSGVLGENVVGYVITWIPGTIVWLIALAFLGGWLGAMLTGPLNRFLDHFQGRNT